MRLAQRVDGVIGEIGNGFAVQLVGGAGIEFEIAGERHGIGAGLLQWLADVACFQIGEHIGLRRNGRAHLHKNASALGGGELAPCACISRLRRFHGGIDIARIARGQRADRFAGRRIFDRQRRFRVAPAACDEVFLGDHVGRLVPHRWY